MTDAEKVKEELEQKLDLNSNWDTQIVRGTAGRIAELYLREDNRDIATVEVISDEQRTVVEISHADYPNWQHANHEEIPGHVGGFTYPSINDALPALETLTDKDQIATVVDLVLSDNTETNNPLKEAIEKVQQ